MDDFSAAEVETGNEDFRPLILGAAVATVARLAADASHVAERRLANALRNV